MLKEHRDQTPLLPVSGHSDLRPDLTLLPVDKAVPPEDQGLDRSAQNLDQVIFLKSDTGGIEIGGDLKILLLLTTPAAGFQGPQAPPRLTVRTGAYPRCEKGITGHLGKIGRFQLLKSVIVGKGVDG